MPFRDPLYRYPSIDNTNFLQPKVENFLELSAPESFHNGIKLLVELKKNLQVAETINRLFEVQYIDMYVQLLQWLKGQLAITTWATLPQLPSYDQIDENIANNFNAFVSTLNSNISSQALYQQIQIMRGVIENKIIQDIAEQIESPFEDKYNRYLVDGRTEVIEALDNTKRENESSINTLYNQQLEAIRLKGQEAISSFEQARALASWSSFYANRVSDYKLMLHGKHWPDNAITNKWHGYRNYRKSLVWRQRLFTIPSVIRGFLGCTRKGCSILLSKATSYSGKRMFWFNLLALGILLFIIINVASLYGFTSIFGIDVSRLKASHGDTQLFAKISTYVALFLLPTVGYSFANKNYRIYSNLLEQYRHREIVAETIQGILARPRGDDTDEAVRKELANVASAALFEQKTVGHLSKSEANSTSILDIVRALKS